MARGGTKTTTALRIAACPVQVDYATREDIPRLAQIKHAVSKKTYASMTSPERLDRWLERNAGEEFFAWRVGRKDYHLLVARHEGRIVGFTGFRQRGKRADFHSVGMYVENPREGVGGQLHEASLELAASLGCTHARSATWRDNDGSKAFHERLGFTPTGSGFRDHVADVRVDHYEATLTAHALG
jgi:L-amino acid N-acyltransferase YncA